jgi:hypothetical protein
MTPHRRPLALVLSACLALPFAACAGDDPAPPAGPTVRITDRTLEFTTGPFTVPGGTDSFECFYTSVITDREFAISSATGLQGPGGHHLTAYYTAATRPAEHHPCTEEEMASWTMIAGTGGEAGVGDDQSLPEGLAIRVPAGVQLVLQAHYINTTPDPLTTDDSVTLAVLPPAEVEAYANMLVVHDDAFEVPARTRYRSTSVCTLTAPTLNVVLFMGHMHASGRQFSLELLPETGDTGSMLYDVAWSDEYSSHPPVLRYDRSAPLVLTGGTRFRQTCTWENTGDQPLIFPNEMCDGVFFYYPDAGDGMIVCNPESQVGESL